MPTISPKTTPYYGGGQVLNPANVIKTSGAPSNKQLGQHNGTIAIDNAAATGYLLVSKSGSVATFKQITFASDAGSFSTVTSAGSITATNGNLILGTAGNKIVSSSVATTTAAGANSFGTVTLVAGTATIATTSVTASSIIMLTRQGVGATGAAALGMLSVGTIVAGTSFVINSWVTANATTLATTDVSSIGWMIIN